MSATSCDNASKGCKNGWRVRVRVAWGSPVIGNGERLAKLCFACHDKLLEALPTVVPA